MLAARAGGFKKYLTFILSQFNREDKPVSFDTKKGPVYEPRNPELKSLYEVLKKNAPALDGSRVFEDLVEVYEALDFDFKEEKVNEPIIRAI